MPFWERGWQYLRWRLADTHAYEVAVKPGCKGWRFHWSLQSLGRRCMRDTKLRIIECQLWALTLPVCRAVEGRSLPFHSALMWCPTSASLPLKGNDPDLVGALRGKLLPKDMGSFFLMLISIIAFSLLPTEAKENLITWAMEFYAQPGELLVVSRLRSYPCQDGRSCGIAVEWANLGLHWNQYTEKGMPWHGPAMRYAAGLVMNTATENGKGEKNVHFLVVL